MQWAGALKSKSQSLSLKAIRLKCGNCVDTCGTSHLPSEWFFFKKYISYRKVGKWTPAAVKRFLYCCPSICKHIHFSDKDRVTC